MLDTMTYDTKIFHLTDLRLHWPFALPTFDSTDLFPYGPSTRDLWHYDHNYTIIFDLTDLPLLNLSFLTCDFPAKFIILDQSMRLDHRYFTFDFLAFDF